MNDADGVEAVRAPIVTLFASFTVHRAGEGTSWPELALGDVYIEPQLREGWCSGRRSCCPRTSRTSTAPTTGLSR